MMFETGLSSWVLVLPARERFSFKVYVFSKDCLILVKGKQNNMLHFYRLHKLLFPENAWNRITLNVVHSVNGRCVTNNMPIRSEIVSKFSNVVKFSSSN